MVMRILKEHGFWLGNMEEKPSVHGYFDYENLEIKMAMRDIWPEAVMWLRTDNCGQFRKTLLELNIKPLPRFKRKLNQIVPENTDWAYKSGIPYWYVWQNLDCMPILVFRPYESMLESWIDKGHEDNDDTRKKLGRVHRAMVHLKHQMPVIETDAVVNGDFSTVETALAHYGFDFSEEATSKAVNPEMWNF